LRINAKREFPALSREKGGKKMLNENNRDVFFYRVREWAIQRHPKLANVIQKLSNEGLWLLFGGEFCNEYDIHQIGKEENGGGE